jgi:hypothetical protein
MHLEALSTFRFAKRLYCIALCSFLARTHDISNNSIPVDAFSTQFGGQTVMITTSISSAFGFFPAISQHDSRVLSSGRRWDGQLPHRS